MRSGKLLPHENSVVESSPEDKATSVGDPADPQRLLEHQDMIVEAPIAVSKVEVVRCDGMYEFWYFGDVLVAKPFGVLVGEI